MSLKKPLLAGLAIAAVCAIAVLLMTRRSQAPVLYEGKSVEQWSVQLYISQEQSARDAASAALKALGPKAVPDIIGMLRNQDPFMRRLVWSLAPKVPLRFRKQILTKVK